MRRRKKAKPHIEVTCSYCGLKTETFVATPDHLLFCRHQVVGFPPTRDCMTDYYKERKDVRKKEEQEKSLFNKQEKQLCEEDKEKEKISRAANAAKLDEYLKELKRKKYEKRLSSN